MAGHRSSGETRTLRDVAAEPNAPTVDLVRARPVEDDALREPFVVLQQEHHALVKVLLPKCKPKFLLGAAEDDAALLDERRLVDVAGGILACVAARVTSSLRGGDELCSELAPVLAVDVWGSLLGAEPR